MKTIQLLSLIFLYACASNQPIKLTTPEATTETKPTESVLTVKIGVKSSLAWVSELADKTKCVLLSNDFQNELKSIQNFDMSEANGAQVLGKMLSTESNISTYTSKNPFSSAIATTYQNDNTLYLNTRKNPRSMPQMINTICHEHSHVAGFSHGDNSPKGKEKTVPYFIGDLCEKHSTKCEEIND